MGQDVELKRLPTHILRTRGVAMLWKLSNSVVSCKICYFFLLAQVVPHEPSGEKNTTTHAGLSPSPRTLTLPCCASSKQRLTPIACADARSKSAILTLGCERGGGAELHSTLSTSSGTQSFHVPSEAGACNAPPRSCAITTGRKNEATVVQQHSRHEEAHSQRTRPHKARSKAFYSQPSPNAGAA